MNVDYSWPAHSVRILARNINMYARYIHTRYIHSFVNLALYLNTSSEALENSRRLFDFN